MHSMLESCFVITHRYVLLWAVMLTKSLSGSLRQPQKGQETGHKVCCNWTHLSLWIVFTEMAQGN